MRRLSNANTQNKHLYTLLLFAAVTVTMLSPWYLRTLVAAIVAAIVAAKRLNSLKSQQYEDRNLK